MLKKSCILLVFLVLAGCSALKPEPEPIIDIRGCPGDLNKNGVVETTEAQAVIVVKYSTVRPSALIVDGVQYTPDDVIRSVDTDADGVISDNEVAHVAYYKTYGCPK